MKQKRFVTLFLPIITLILELLPYGAVLNFAHPATDGTIGRFRKTFSYFSLTPFGYANFAPLLTAILTCAILLILLLFCATGKRRTAVVAKGFLIAAVLLSLFPLLLGVSYYSPVGALISLTLLAELVLLHITLKGIRN